MIDSDDIMEGFLCPNCRKDLRSANQLILHFQEVHNDDPDVLKSLKDIFGKAKKKIMKQDVGEDASGFDNYRAGSRQDWDLRVDWEPQELGATRSHLDRLRLFRNARNEQYCAETNKLIVRLDKLLLDAPTDPAKRKAHEQSVVCWVDDEHVKRCPSCARSFFVMRRKHHCRLCGAIMCHECSYFVSQSDAKKMTSASNADGSTLYPKSDSAHSLDSAANQDTDLRMCEHCYQRLSQREELKEARSARPIICQFYEKLQALRDEAERLCTEYHKMCASLWSGESLYHLSDAQMLRVKLIKLADGIDSTSKAILVLGIRGGESSAPKGRTLRLQQAVRSSATNFLRDQLVGLPSLPSEAQLQAFQEKHKKRVESRVSPVSSSPRPPNQPQVLTETGWGPSTTAKQLLRDSDDPMVLQMNNLRNYIRQAREAHKYDEVRMLEENLRLFQEEYWKQHQDLDVTNPFRE